MTIYNNSINNSSPSIAAHSLVVSEGSNNQVGVLLTNGELAIGSTGADPVSATITAGTGLSVVNGAGSITISVVGGGLPWTVVTATTQAAAVNNGYIANSTATGPVVATLPATAAVGSVVAIAGIGSEGWTLAANTGQTIQFGNTASSSGGSWSSSNQYDTVYVLCVVANTTWLVLYALSGGLVKA